MNKAVIYRGRVVREVMKDVRCGCRNEYLESG